MSGRARFRLGVCAVLLLCGACVVRVYLPQFLQPEAVTAAAVAAAAREPGLPLLGYNQGFPEEAGKPHVPNPAFFEEQATREEILERLARYKSTLQSAPDKTKTEQDGTAEADESVATEKPEREAQPEKEIGAELVSQFQKWEQGRLIETSKGTLKSDDMTSAEALAVSASGTVVALVTGEQCRLFDIQPSDSSESELKILPRTEPASIELPGREGDSLLLDFDGQHILYLARGGVVWAANIQSGEAAPIDAERLSECILLGGGLRGGWMVAGTKQGEVILFNLQGTVLKSEKTPWPNLDSAPELQSVACDPKGEIVLAGFQNDAIRWFRRQDNGLKGDNGLKVDGGLEGFPGRLQSVSTNGTQFAVAGALFYYVCRAPEAGKPIDLKRGATRETTHHETQIALSGDDSAPYITLWGECPQISSDRTTVWLYSSHVRSGYIARPFLSSTEKTARLRELAKNGSLVVAVSDDSLHVAQPAGRDVPPPTPYAEMIQRLLDEERYEEIERCTRYLGDPQRRFPDEQEAWIFCVARVLMASDGDHRVRENRLLEWLDAHPNSLTAWLALAEHYIASAWAARGGEFADKVTDFGWEMVGQRVPKSDLIARTLLAASCEEPALYDLAARQTGIAGWSHLERKRFGERAVELFPDYIDLHSNLAFFRLQRWGGSAAEAMRHIEMVADAAEEKQRDAYYALLVAILLKSHPPNHGLEEVPVDLDRMHRGLLLPTPRGHSGSDALSRVLQAAAIKGEIAYAGFYFDQLASEHPLLPNSANLETFRSLHDWATGAHAMLVAHMKGLEEKAKAEEKAADDEAAGVDEEATAEVNAGEVEDVPAAAL